MLEACCPFPRVERRVADAGQWQRAPTGIEFRWRHRLVQSQHFKGDLSRTASPQAPEQTTSSRAHGTLNMPAQYVRSVSIMARRDGEDDTDPEFQHATRLCLCQCQCPGARGAANRAWHWNLEIMIPVRLVGKWRFSIGCTTAGPARNHQGSTSSNQQCKTPPLCRLIC